MPALIAKLVAQPGKRDDLVAAVQGLLQAVEDEPGTTIYIMHTCAAEPEAVYFYESYTDADAMTLHAKSDAMREAGRAMKGLLAGAPEFTVLDEVARKGA